MSDKTFHHHHNPHFHADLMFSPHIIKPPDAISFRIFSRIGICISVIFSLLLFCPRAGSETWSVFDGFSRNFAEAWLLVGRQFPRQFEGFELGFISQSDSKPLSVVYNITPYKDSWLFITPCSHSQYLIIIQSLVSDYDNRQGNRTVITSKGSPLEWNRRITNIDMTHASGLGESISIADWKRQEMHVTNLKLGIMRVDVNRNDPVPSVYMIRQYSGQIDAFYPRIPPNPVVKVCSMDTRNLVLSIHVSRAANTDLYCAAFNMNEDLPNFCTAQLRINKTLFQYQKRRENLNFRRPRVFDDFYRYVKLDPIVESEFRCFQTNRFDVSLPKSFMRKPIYINIYAVNMATEFTDSYQPVKYVWGDNDNRCDAVDKMVVMDQNNPHVWVMGNVTVFFNITSNNVDRVKPIRLFYQGCKSNIKESLKLYRREIQSPVCIGVSSSRVTAFCDPLQSGEYRFQHNINDRSNYSMPIGQIFLSNNIRAFPHLVCNKTKLFTLTLHRAPLEDSNIHYQLNISFNIVLSPYDITYYFHILVFPTAPNNTDSLPDRMSRIKYQVQSERNFCLYAQDLKKLKSPIHNVTLKGQGCGSKPANEYQTSIPGSFDRNHIYAVLVYFSRANNRMGTIVQFYSNVVFTLYSDEEVF